MNTPPPAASASPALRLGVVGAGPAGLVLALLAGRTLPGWSVTLFDARPLDLSLLADPRTLALSLGSVQLLQRLQCWPGEAAQAITQVHVSQAPPTLRAAWARPEVVISAKELGVAQLGAVLHYGPLVAALQDAWTAAVSAAPGRLHSAFGSAVSNVASTPAGATLDADVVEEFDLVVVAEGGVFAEQAPKSLRHDYQQTAWVGTATLAAGTPGLAVECFTRHGPVALLPLPPHPSGELQAALVWCVASGDDPVRALSPQQRVVVLNELLPDVAGRVSQLSPLKPFALGLNAQRTLVDRRVVRIGNAAQTLHPVAGQGLNLGLRDAFALVQALRFAPNVDAALRRSEWQRAPDRWTTIAATDFLARSFTWAWPGAGAVRGLALAAFQAATPAKHLLAEQMMFGRR